MKKLFKKLLIVSLALLIVGGLICGVSMLVVNGDIHAVSYLKSVQDEYVEDSAEPITSISIKSQTTDVNVAFSDTAEKVSISYPRLMTKKDSPASDISLSVSDGKLQFSERIKPLKASFGWNFLETEINVTLPAERSYALSISVDTGDIRVSGTDCNLTRLYLSTDTGDIRTKDASILCAENIQLETDTGDISFGAFQAKNFSAETDTGDITLQNGTVSEKIELNIDTGDIRLNGTLHAYSIDMETDTGDVYGSNGILDSEKISIETDTGDVKIKLFGNQNDYSIYMDANHGDSNVPSQGGGEKTLSISTNTGDVFVHFTE